MGGNNNAKETYRAVENIRLSGKNRAGDPFEDIG
jgi:hypothetical protein